MFPAIAFCFGFALLTTDAPRFGPSTVWADAYEPPSASHRAAAKAREKSSRVRSLAENLPLYFIENRGQVDRRVAYYVQGTNKSIYFTADGLTLVLSDAARQMRAHSSFAARALPGEDSEQESPPRLAVKLEFVGADMRVVPRGEEPTAARISYFKGAESEWKTGLRTYRRVVYPNLWPGIDLVYSGTVRQLKYMFVVHPGADPQRIQLRYRGADSVAVVGGGQLQVQTALGGFQDDRPSGYQEVKGEKRDVAVRYALGPEAEPGTYLYGFDLSSYDSSRLLIIDPAILVYAGFVGGAGDDRGNAIAVDGDGNAYITGETSSAEAAFPDGDGFGLLPGLDKSHNGGVDAFVAKLNAGGTALVYAGYIGGAGDDRGNGIAVDGAGAAYVTGETISPPATFPTIVGPDLTYNLGVDAFVAKVNAGGTALVYAGYIGGSSDDRGRGIALQPGESGCPPDCSVYIVGETNSVQTTFPDGDGFGPVAGFDQTYNGGIDAFVTKVNAAGTALVYASYIGGSGDDRGKGIAVDGAGGAYVIGETNSVQTTFPDGDGFGLSLPGFDQTQNGGIDAFVAKLNTAGTALAYASYIGGSGDDRGNGIAVDAAQNAYVTGETNSTQATFPDGNGFGAVPGFDQTYNGGVDGFVAMLDSAGTTLVHGSYLGGSGDDRGKGIALDANADIYVVGETNSIATTFPAKFGPDLTQNGAVDAFVAKICSAVCVDLSVGQSDSPRPVRVGDNLTYTITVSNNGPDDATGVVLTDTLPATVVLVSVTPSVGSCAVTTPVRCELGNLTDGGSATVVIVVATTAKGTLTNVVNIAGEQADPNIRNNENTLNTVATLSNLILRTLKTPAAALPGQDIVIDDTTMNSGAVAADATTTRFYLSTDGKFDAGDLFLGSRGIPPLAPRTSSSGATTVTIPLASAIGRYFLIGVADADNAVIETRENNQRNRPIQVTRPDLDVASLRAPSSAAAGASITLQDTTRNKNLVPSEASTTKFYLSADALLDGADPLLGGRAVPALAAKGKSAGSTTVTIPLTTAPGVYFLLAVADADGSITEADEGNNLRSRKITVKP